MKFFIDTVPRAITRLPFNVSDNRILFLLWLGAEACVFVSGLTLGFHPLIMAVLMIGLALYYPFLMEALTRDRTEPDLSSLKLSDDAKVLMETFTIIDGNTIVFNLFFSANLLTHLNISITPEQALPLLKEIDKAIRKQRFRRALALYNGAIDEVAVSKDNGLANVILTTLSLPVSQDDIHLLTRAGVPLDTGRLTLTGYDDLSVKD